MYRRTTAHICSQIHPGNRRTYSLVPLTSVGVGLREGWGAVHSQHGRAGEGNYHTGHVIEDLASEPERAPPRQSQPSIQLDCRQGKCKAATGKARPFGPPPDEVENVRKPVVGFPDNTRSAWISNQGSNSTVCKVTTGFAAMLATQSRRPGYPDKTTWSAPFQ